MIIEERDYRIKPGKTMQFVSLYEQYGLPIQKEYLGNLLGYFVSDIGELNHVVAWWGFLNLDDRVARRNCMLALPEWQSYLDRVTDFIDVQNTRILNPMHFSPIR
jgi:hypothetical protein